MERNNMDISLQKYYDSRLTMTSSTAWRDLMDDVQKMLDATDQLSGVTVDNLRFKQGELSIMRWLLNLADTSEKAYEMLKDEDANT
jgi:hypothetical protein